MRGMNKLPSAKRAEILGMMVEGVSLRAISRLTGASKNTIVKLLEDAGKAFGDYQDKTLRGLTCKRIQVDEIWAFVYCKAKNVATAKAAPKEAGDMLDLARDRRGHQADPVVPRRRARRRGCTALHRRPGAAPCQSRAAHQRRPQGVSGGR